MQDGTLFDVDYEPELKTRGIGEYAYLPGENGAERDERIRLDVKNNRHGDFDGDGLPNYMDGTPLLGRDGLRPGPMIGKGLLGIPTNATGQQIEDLLKAVGLIEWGRDSGHVSWNDDIPDFDFSNLSPGGSVTVESFVAGLREIVLSTHSHIGPVNSAAVSLRSHSLKRGLLSAIIEIHVRALGNLPRSDIDGLIGFRNRLGDEMAQIRADVKTASIIRTAVYELVSEYFLYMFNGADGANVVPFGAKFVDSAGAYSQGDSISSHNAPSKYRNKGTSGGEETVGDPVSTASGALFSKAVDLSTAGRSVDFAVVRNFNSLSSTLGIFGWKWESPILETRILFSLVKSEADAYEAYVAWGDGTWSTFVLDLATDTYEGIDGEYGKLRRYASAPFESGIDCDDGVGYANGWVLRRPDGSLLYFCPKIAVAGIGPFAISWLRKVSDPYGNALTVKRNEWGNPYEVIDSLGRVVTITYNSARLVEKIVDHEGNQWDYSYDLGKRELTRVDKPNTQVVSGGAFVLQRPYDGYTYSEHPDGWEENRDPLTNHNITEIYASSTTPSVTVEYYGLGGYSEARVKSVTESGFVTRFEYTSILTPLSGTGYPAEAYGAIHRTDALYPNGRLSSYYHDDKGMLVWRQTKSEVYTDFGLPQTGSAYPGEPDEWWETWTYSDDYEALTFKRSTDALYPSDRWLLEEYVYDDQNADRFQHGNVTLFTRTPDTGASFTANPAVVSMVYDPLSVQPCLVTDPEGNETEAYRGHNELSYAAAQQLPVVTSWGLLPDPNPAALIWGKGDVNGDGIVGGTHKVVQRVKAGLTGLGSPPSGEIVESLIVATTIKYNDVGQVIETYDGVGLTKVYSYLNGYLRSVTNNPSGINQTVTYTRDGFGRVTEQRAHDGQLVLNAYDARGFLSSSTKVHELEADHDDCQFSGAPGSIEVCQIQHGLTLRLYHDVKGQLVGTYGPMSDISAGPFNPSGLGELDTQYVNDDRGNMIGLTRWRRSPNGGTQSAAVWSMMYGPTGKLVGMTTADGAIFQYKYNVLGQAAEIWRAIDGSSPFLLTSHAVRNWMGGPSEISTLTDGSVQPYAVVTFEHDGFGRLKKHTSETLLETLWDYDNNGLTLAETTSFGGVQIAKSTAEYDAWGQIRRKVTETTTVGADGTVTAGSDAPAQKESTFGYTNRPGQIAWVIEDVGTVERQLSLRYDELGRFESALVFDGAVETLRIDREYDLGGRVLREDSVHDNLGTTGSVSPSTTSRTFTYDSYARPFRVKHEDDTADVYVYDERGYPSAHLTPEGILERFQNDSRGNVLRRTEIGAGILRYYDYTYDHMDRMLTFRDASTDTSVNPAITERIYNSIGLLERETLVSGLTNAYETAYQYNNADLVSQITEDNGIQTNVVYTLDGLPSNRVQVDTTGVREAVSTDFTFNCMRGASQVSQTVGAGTTSFVSWDRLSSGAPVKVTRWKGAEAPITYSRTFDNLFNVATETYTDGMTVERAYDSAGRALSVGINSEATPYLSLSGHYRGGMPRVLTYLDGTVVSRELNSLGLEVSLDVHKSGVGHRSDEYEYLPGGSIMEIRDLLSGSKEVFEYDGVDRIKHWGQLDSNGVALRTQDWVYDVAGNVDSFSDSLDTPQVMTANIFNQYTQVLPALPSISFGLGGEEVTRTSASTTRSNAWDASGRLTEMDEADAGGSVANSQVEYWPDGLVKSRAYSDGTGTNYWYDAAGNVIGTEFGGFSQAIVYFRGKPVFSVDAGVKRSMVSNWRGDLVTMDTPTGFESYVYTPYGELGAASGGVGQANAFMAPMFGGAQYDREFGTVQFGARAYDPALGRFLARDPIGLAGGSNLYRFANNNPYKYIDPSGFSPEMTQPSSLGSIVSADPRFEYRNGGYFLKPGVSIPAADWFDLVAANDKGFPMGAKIKDIYKSLSRSEKKALWAKVIPGQKVLVDGLSGEDRQAATKILNMYYSEMIDVFMDGSLSELISEASSHLGEVTIQAASEFKQGATVIGVIAYDVYDYVDTRKEVLVKAIADGLGAPPVVSNTLGFFAAMTSPTQIVSKGGKSFFKKFSKRRARKKFGLPGWKKVKVDIDHIADRHIVGGAGVTDGRTVFAGMNRKGVQAAIKQAYGNADIIKIQGDRALLYGVSKTGVHVEMWFNKATNLIETAYTVASK